jgi:sigma-B regulation protein RsbU (phosphoserine phosphatase)
MFDLNQGKAALRKQVESLRSILFSLSEGVIVADRQGKFLFFNPVAERILGVGSTDITPDKWTEVYGCFLPDRVTPYPADQLPLARAMRGVEVMDEVIFIRNPEVPSGTWILASARPVRNAAGIAEGGVVIFRDITARKHACERSERLSKAVEQTADSVIITDKNGVIEYVNPAFEQTTGYQSDEALGQTPKLLKSGKHSITFYRSMWKKLLGGAPYRGTIINRKKDGTLYWAEQTITPMKDDDGKITHFVSVLKDVTEQRKKQEQELHLGLAREVQQRFYRQPAPPFPGFDIAGGAYPADQTGGDYFDFLSMPDGCLGIAIGDVTGHGFASALVMAETRAYLRSVAKTESDAGKALTLINNVLAADLDGGRFVTLLLARIDPKERTLMYASAGHVPGYLFDGTGEVSSILESTGCPLGLFPGSTIPTSGTIDLDAGEMLVLLTDGITEAKASDETEFGTESKCQPDRRDPLQGSQSTCG